MLGIGACSSALDRLNIEHEIVDAVEIDKYAVKSFNAVHHTSFEPQDICLWDKKINVDLIMHGSPCQDFSIAGKQAGGDEGSGTRSSLMYETLRIIEKLKPNFVIWENVKNLISKKHWHNFDNYLNKMVELGYDNYYQVLNAKDYGIPQNRERVFTISIRSELQQKFAFPDKEELKLKLKDVLQENVDEKYFLSQKTIDFFVKNEEVQKAKGNGFRFGVSDGNLVGKAVTTRAGGRMDDNFIKIKNATKQGYSIAHEGDSVNFEYPNSNTRRGRVGNQVAQTLQCNNSIGVILSDCQRLNSLVEKTSFEEGKVLNMDLYNQTTNEEVSKCLKQPNHADHRLFDGYRIRKLTPLETWRLMGFTDDEFERAKNVPTSDTQLYKQARKLYCC